VAARLKCRSVIQILPGPVIIVAVIIVVRDSSAE
jgi:hypothetical protein